MSVIYFNLQICNVMKKKEGTSTKPAEMNVTNNVFQNALDSSFELFTQKKKICYHLLFVFKSWSRGDFLMKKSCVKFIQNVSL